MNYIFETVHLGFRKFDIKDANDLYKHHKENELKKWIPNESYEDINEAKGAIEFFSQCVEKDKLPFVLAIVLKANAQLIGDIGINEVEGNKGEVEIGFCICEEHQGNGYATEALLAVTDYVSSHFKTNILYGRIMHGNITSVRLMEKCNYKYVTEEFGAEDDPYGNGMMIYKRVF